MNHLQQRLEELRRLQQAPLPNSNTATASSEHMSAEDEEGSQSDEADQAHEMEVESEEVKEELDSDAEERACLVLAGLRAGSPPAAFPRWHPAEIPAPSETQFRVGLKLKVPRAESPPGSRGGSSSSGATVPGSSPRMEAQTVTRGASKLDRLQMNEMQVQ